MFCRCRFSPIYSSTVNAKKLDKYQRRFKNGPNHWSVLAKNKTSRDKALEHFDDFYTTVFGVKWPSIRLALLSRSKYCALVNNYSDTDRIIPFFESMGAIDLKALLDVQIKKIQEKKNNKRNSKMDLTYKMDDKLEKLSKKKYREEMEALYPNDSYSGVSQEIPGENELFKLPNERFIDGSIGLSSSSLHEFVPATKLKGKEDWVAESEHYSYYASSSDFPVKVEEQTSLEFPSHLKLYTFEMGNVTRFPKPRKGETGVSDYYLLDGGSILPVLALGLEAGDKVLDMCAAPGGKSLLCLQTLYPKIVVCNDVSLSRTNRIKRIMNEFFYDFDKKQSSGEIVITRNDSRYIEDTFQFNKILVDVPCTNDRHSLHEEDNNMFKPSRIKERIKLPELQAEILANALKIVEPGGTVVYSTCSLSPIQNDGVVQMALKKIWEETDHEITVVNMRKAIEPARVIYRFGDNIGLKYGHLVLPYLPANYGPMYFCKLVKNK